MRFGTKLGIILIGWGLYGAVSSYLTGNTPLSILLVFVSATILIAILGNSPNIVYLSILCIRDGGTVMQFPLGVSQNLVGASVMVKAEARAREEKTKSDKDFSTATDFYLVQEKEVGQPITIKTYEYTKLGDLINTGDL